jgi:gliding motility-associated-like protein
VVSGTDKNGCSATDTLTVVVLQPCPFYIPNAFKPETTDALGNGVFGVLGQAIATEAFLLRIYSRWGELVFQSDNPETPWNGIFNGQSAPAGVYLYQLEMTNCDGLLKTTGNLTLIR